LGVDFNKQLVYNYFRTYDPSTGRYLESDPIGLDGGPNTFTYAANSPIDISDRYGLCSWCSPILTIGARPTPMITPRPNPVAQGVRNAIRQMEQSERANPASKYNQNRIDQILRDTGMPPRLRLDQMVETVDSCPIPPRINPGNTRPDTLNFLQEVLKIAKDLHDSGVIDHSPVPITPTNQLWPARAIPAVAPGSSSGGTMSDRDFEQCFKAGMCT
jgi:RHS repeat-associated protein